MTRLRRLRALAIEPPRRQRILALALPIIGGMVSQNVLNLVDTAMVGVLGNSAIGAVGFGGVLNFVTSAFILGLGTGVQAMAARRLGEGRDKETAIPLNGGLVLAAALAIPWSIALWFAVPHIFPYLNDDAAVVGDGVPYLRARVVAMTALAMNYTFRGYWNATDRAALYMRTLVFMHALNILLNWVLIYGNLGFSPLGAPGAGVASSIATWAGTLYYVWLGLRHAKGHGFARGLPDMSTLRSILRLSLPAGVQQFFFAASYVAFFWIAGEVGTAELAATHVIVNLMLVGTLPGMGFGMASMSLVGQALGRADANDARRWGWEVVRLATVTVALISLPGILFPELLLGFFLHDAGTLAMACTPFVLVGLLLGLDAAGRVLMYSLMGAGATRSTMLVSSAVNWLLALPLAFLVGPTLGYGLTAIWIASLGARQLQMLVFATLWRGDGWTRIAV